MMFIPLKKSLNSKVTGKVFIIIASVILIYLLISIYFAHHFFYNTTINGVKVSLKAYQDANDIIRSSMEDYELQIIDKNGVTEVITGQSIGMKINDKNNISTVCDKQNSLKWLISLFRSQKYYLNDLYVYNKESLDQRIGNLKCFHNKEVIEPRNVEFKYLNGCYEVIKEVEGNKIIKDKLSKAIIMNLLNGKKELFIHSKIYYDNPKYTIRSNKTIKTKKLLDKYVATTIVYEFGREFEILDGSTINKWLKVNDNLDIIINKTAVENYIKKLSNEYDTVGTARKFKTSIGKIVEVKGGLYGWKINQDAETKALIENIKLGDIIEKEPVYTRMALSRGEDEIGNTYVEINITRQHLWYYKDGKLIAQGPVVTGNPNRGNATVLGIYMLNYKMEGETLSGVNYEVKVNYWMPFYGNMGIHDAKWRYSFGGEIYKRNGTHGCVNAPYHLAKTIYENIEEGIPIICYEE